VLVLAFGLSVSLWTPLDPPDARSEEAPSEEVPSSPAPEGGELDRLLRLPATLDYQVERRGGSTRGEWRKRFREARGELSEARDALARSQQELEGAASESDAWLLKPPGVGGDASDASVHYRLREQVRRQRGEVDRAEKRLRDLEIEADLAGVPGDWRDSPPGAADSSDDR
jgi:hypothetical protein